MSKCYKLSCNFIGVWVYFLFFYHFGYCFVLCKGQVWVLKYIFMSKCYILSCNFICVWVYYLFFYLFGYWFILYIAFEETSKQFNSDFSDLISILIDTNSKISIECQCHLMKIFKFAFHCLLYIAYNHTQSFLKS